MSEDWMGLLVGGAFLVAAVANSRWDFMTITDATKPPVFAEADREMDERRATVRRGAQKLRTVFLSGLGGLLVVAALVRLVVEAVRG